MARAISQDWANPGDPTAGDPQRAGAADRQILIIKGVPDPDPFDPERAVQDFVHLSGGTAGRIVVVPVTRSDQLGYGRRYAYCLAAVGGGMVTVLHIDRRAHADDTNACYLLSGATGILLIADDYPRLVARLGGSAALNTIRQRFQNGCAVAMTAAGNALMTTVMPAFPPAAIAGEGATFM